MADRGSKRRGEPEQQVKSNPKVNPATAVPVISIKGSPQWKDWLDALAVHCRMPKSVLIDIALSEFARSKNFGKEPPIRQLNA